MLEKTHLLPYVVDSEIELVPLEMDYLHELFALVDRGRHYLRRWQNWPDQIRTLRDMRGMIQSSQRKTRSNDGFDAIILYNGEPAGKIGLVYIDWRERVTEIGYWLGQNYQKRGLMTRSCRVFTDYALMHMHLRLVRIRCAAGNLGSAAIPERLGYTFDGQQPYQVWLHGRAHDELQFSMTRNQWKQKMIYHITTRDEWDAAQLSGVYSAPSLQEQGFIHLASLEQVIKVANVIYHGQQDLVLLCIDPGRLEADHLHYEPPDASIPAVHYEGELFPHYYAPIPVQVVSKVVAFPPNDDGSFNLPSELA